MFSHSTLDIHQKKVRSVVNVLTKGRVVREDLLDVNFGRGLILFDDVLIRADNSEVRRFGKDESILMEPAPRIITSEQAEKRKREKYKREKEKYCLQKQLKSLENYKIVGLEMEVVMNNLQTINDILNDARLWRMFLKKHWEEEKNKKGWNKKDDNLITFSEILKTRLKDKKEELESQQRVQS